MNEYWQLLQRGSSGAHGKHMYLAVESAFSGRNGSINRRRVSAQDLTSEYAHDIPIARLRADPLHAMIKPAGLAHRQAGATEQQFACGCEDWDLTAINKSERSLLRYLPREVWSDGFG